MITKTITENGQTRQLYYISAPGGLAALYVKQTGQTDKIYYPYTDHLGSIVKLTDGSGAEVFKASYDAWGNRTVSNNTFAFHRGFTGHEHLAEFKLINMNGRMYDPVLGRFLNPDPIVPNYDFSQDYNRDSYTRNNPLAYVDPDGENPFLIALGLYCLFFTDFGYDVQKAISPVAVKIDFRLGSNQGAIGADASIGVPQLFPVSYRVHGGATYFWKNEDLMANNMSSWETRYGGEWGISFDPAFQIKYGGTTFNSKWSGKQTTNLFTLGNPLINVKYENDMVPEGIFAKIPFVPKGDGDRHRTAAAQLNIGPFGIGTKMMTGDPMENGTKPYDSIDGKDTYTGEHANDYRMGIFYFKVGPFRFGKNSENTRKIFQNQFAHDWLTGGQSKWFKVLSLKSKWYWGFGYSGGGTLY